MQQWVFDKNFLNLEFFYGTFLNMPTSNVLFINTLFIFVPLSPTRRGQKTAVQTCAAARGRTAVFSNKNYLLNFLSPLPICEKYDIMEGHKGTKDTL